MSIDKKLDLKKIAILFNNIANGDEDAVLDVVEKVNVSKGVPYSDDEKISRDNGLKLAKYLAKEKNNSRAKLLLAKFHVSATYPNIPSIEGKDNSQCLNDAFELTFSVLGGKRVDEQLKREAESFCEVITDRSIELMPQKAQKIVCEKFSN